MCESIMSNFSRLRSVVFAMVATAALVTLGPACGGADTPANNKSAAATDYTIGPGDVLTLTVADAPEFGGKLRVADSGSIRLQGVTEPVMAEGKTTSQLADTVRQAFIDAKQLRDPQVSVFVDEFHGRTVTVLGAVSKPAVYSLQKRTTVLEAISAAGGALPGSGSTVTVVRGEASAEATNTKLGSVQILDLARLTKGEDVATSMEVRNGDVVSVSSAQLVYVVGAVIKPGGFALSNPADGVTAAQAIALAEGFTSVASTHRGLIVRQSASDQARREIPVDLEKIMKGQETDVVLAPNDILYVPNSGAKQTLKVMGEIAMATVNGIAIYGIGYRLGTM